LFSRKAAIACTTGTEPRQRARSSSNGTSRAHLNSLLQRLEGGGKLVGARGLADAGHLDVRAEDVERLQRWRRVSGESAAHAARPRAYVIDMLGVSCHIAAEARRSRLVGLEGAVEVGIESIHVGWRVACGSSARSAGSGSRANLLEADSNFFEALDKSGKIVGRHFPEQQGETGRATDCERERDSKRKERSQAMMMSSQPHCFRGNRWDDDVINVYTHSDVHTVPEYLWYRL
jgi:hypothetical protein